MSGSDVVDETVAVLSIDEPAKLAATSTVNDVDAPPPAAITPRSHVTVPAGASVHSAGSNPLTESPNGSTSTAVESAESDGPPLDTLSPIVVVSPALTVEGVNVLSI